MALAYFMLCPFGLWVMTQGARRNPSRPVAPSWPRGVVICPIGWRLLRRDGGPFGCRSPLRRARMTAVAKAAPSGDQQRGAGLLGHVAGGGVGRLPELAAGPVARVGAVGDAAAGESWALAAMSSIRGSMSWRRWCMRLSALSSEWLAMSRADCTVSLAPSRMSSAAWCAVSNAFLVVV